MRFFHPCILFFYFASLFAAHAETNVEGQKLAGRVREIFEVKCIDCHGPELPRPKGKFGYVLDLKRVAGNPDYIVPGHPEKSDLFDMVFKDDMPGEDANVPPLTKDEKEIVKRWIELGAPEPEAGAGERSAVASNAPVESKPKVPFWRHALRWIGHFHPVSTHIPVGMMLVAVLAEALAWWTRRDSWLQTVRFLVVLAALGGIAAATLGWINAYFATYTGQLVQVLWWHRWLGTSTAVWATICAALVMISECKEGSPERQRFRGALIVGAILVSVSGFLGSALIYGLDHYAW